MPRGSIFRKEGDGKSDLMLRDAAAPLLIFANAVVERGTPWTQNNGII